MLLRSANVLPSAESVTQTRSLPVRAVFTSTERTPARMSLRVVIPSIRLAAGTGSIHPVCQIPVTGVYQMPWGSSTCLPWGWKPLSVESVTLTVSFCTPLAESAGVMSNEKGVYPPV